MKCNKMEGSNLNGLEDEEEEPLGGDTSNFLKKICE
jgi:hypothetical protein